MKTATRAAFSSSNLNSLNHLPPIQTYTRMDSSQKRRVMENKSRQTRPDKVFPSFYDDSKRNLHSSYEPSSRETDVLVDISALTSAYGEREDSVFHENRETYRLPREIAEKGPGRRYLGKRQILGENSAHLPAITDLTDSKIAENSLQHKDKTKHVQSQCYGDGLPRYVTRGSRNPRYRHCGRRDHRTEQDKRGSGILIKKTRTQSVNNETEALSIKARGHHCLGEVFPNKQKLNHVSKKKTTCISPDINQTKSNVRLPSFASDKIIPEKAKTKSLYKQSSFQLISSDALQKRETSNSEGISSHYYDSRRFTNGSKTAAISTKKSNLVEDLQTAKLHILALRELRKRITLDPKKRMKSYDSEYLSAERLLSVTQRSRSQSAHTSNAHKYKEMADAYARNQGLKAYNSKLKIPRRPQTRPDKQDERLKANVTSSCPSLRSKHFATNHSPQKKDFWSMGEIAKYKKIMSVYLDSGWQQKRRERFYQKLEQTQLRNWREKRTALLDNTRKLEESRERQTKQLRYIRHKHEHRRSKRLNTQHVKWKYVLGGDTDRAQYGLPSEYYVRVSNLRSYITYYGFSPIPPQNTTSSKNTEDSRQHHSNKTSSVKQRKLLFNEDLDLNELRKRNKQRYDNMFEIGKNKPTKVIEEILKNGLFVIEMSQENVEDSKPVKADQERKNHHSVRFQDNPKVLQKKPSKLILVKNVVKEAEALIESLDETYSEDFESDSN